MDQRIIALESSTFSGRRLNRQQIADIQETVALLPNDSRNELAKTICEHLRWTTAKGDYRVGACLGMLETLESHGILTLPPKREDHVRDMMSAPAWTSASDPQPAIVAPLSELRPLRVEPVTDSEGRQLWSALVDRHHYLGYRRPFGAHVLYFVTDRDGRRLGCLLFDAVTKRLPCRDRWIGWKGRTRDRRRHLMVVNSRFLVFSWVRSKYLASSALALATRRLADDWERLHGWRPVLCETFVDARPASGPRATGRPTGSASGRRPAGESRARASTLRRCARAPGISCAARAASPRSRRRGPSGAARRPATAASTGAGRRSSRPPPPSRRARTRAGRSAAACSTAC